MKLNVLPGFLNSIFPKTNEIFFESVGNDKGILLCCNLPNTWIDISSKRMKQQYKSNSCKKNDQSNISLFEFFKFRETGLN